MKFNRKLVELWWTFKRSKHVRQAPITMLIVNIPGSKEPGSPQTDNVSAPTQSPLPGHSGIQSSNASPSTSRQQQSVHNGPLVLPSNGIIHNQSLPEFSQQETPSTGAGPRPVPTYPPNGTHPIARWPNGALRVHPPNGVVVHNISPPPHYVIAHQTPNSPSHLSPHHGTKITDHTINGFKRPHPVTHTELISSKQSPNPKPSFNNRGTPPTVDPGAGPSRSKNAKSSSPNLPKDSPTLQIPTETNTRLNANTPPNGVCLPSIVTAEASPALSQTQQTPNSSASPAIQPTKAKSSGKKGRKKATTEDATDSASVAGNSGTAKGEAKQAGSARKRKPPADSTETETKKKKGYTPSYIQEGDVCIVCGDESTGLHYRALTCEGCKGFFRREVQKSKGKMPTIKCVKGTGNCVIYLKTRNTCTACRFKACVKAKMDLSAVLDEKARAKLKKTIVGNRVKKLVEVKYSLTPKIQTELDMMGTFFKSCNYSRFFQYHSSDSHTQSNSFTSVDETSREFFKLVTNFLASIPEISKLHGEDILAFIFPRMKHLLLICLAEAWDQSKDEVKFSDQKLCKSCLQSDHDYGGLRNYSTEERLDLSTYYDAAEEWNAEFQNQDMSSQDRSGDHRQDVAFSTSLNWSSEDKEQSENSSENSSNDHPAPKSKPNWTFEDQLYRFVKRNNKFVTSNGIILACLAGIAFLNTDLFTAVNRETSGQCVNNLYISLVKHLRSLKPQTTKTHHVLSCLVDLQEIVDTYPERVSEICQDVKTPDPEDLQRTFLLTVAGCEQRVAEVVKASEQIEGPDGAPENVQVKAEAPGGGPGKKSATTGKKKKGKGKTSAGVQQPSEAKSPATSSPSVSIPPTGTTEAKECEAKVVEDAKDAEPPVASTPPQTIYAGGDRREVPNDLSEKIIVTHYGFGQIAQSPQSTMILNSVSDPVTTSSTNANFSCHNVTANLISNTDGARVTPVDSPPQIDIYTVPSNGSISIRNPPPIRATDQVLRVKQEVSSRIDHEQPAFMSVSVPIPNYQDNRVHNNTYQPQMSEGQRSSGWQDPREIDMHRSFGHPPELTVKRPDVPNYTNRSHSVYEPQQDYQSYNAPLNLSTKSDTARTEEDIKEELLRMNSKVQKLQEELRELQVAGIQQTTNPRSRSSSFGGTKTAPSYPLPGNRVHTPPSLGQPVNCGNSRTYDSSPHYVPSPESDNSRTRPYGTNDNGYIPHKSSHYEYRPHQHPSTAHSPKSNHRFSPYITTPPKQQGLPYKLSRENINSPIQNGDCHHTSPPVRFDQVRNLRETSAVADILMRGPPPQPMLPTRHVAAHALYPVGPSVPLRSSPSSTGPYNTQGTTSEHRSEKPFTYPSPEQRYRLQDEQSEENPSPYKSPNAPSNNDIYSQHAIRGSGEYGAPFIPTTSVIPPFGINIFKHPSDAQRSALASTRQLNAPPRNDLPAPRPSMNYTAPPTQPTDSLLRYLASTSSSTLPSYHTPMTISTRSSNNAPRSNTTSRPSGEPQTRSSETSPSSQAGGTSSNPRYSQNGSANSNRPSRPSDASQTRSSETSPVVAVGTSSNPRRAQNGSAVSAPSRTSNASQTRSSDTSPVVAAGTSSNPRRAQNGSAVCNTSSRPSEASQTRSSETSPVVSVGTCIDPKSPQNGSAVSSLKKRWMARHSFEGPDLGSPPEQSLPSNVQDNLTAGQNLTGAAQNNADTDRNSSGADQNNTRIVHSNSGADQSEPGSSGRGGRRNGGRARATRGKKN